MQKFIAVLFALALMLAFVPACDACNGGSASGAGLFGRMRANRQSRVMSRQMSRAPAAVVVIQAAPMQPQQGQACPMPERIPAPMQKKK